MEVVLRRGLRAGKITLPNFWASFHQFRAMTGNWSLLYSIYPLHYISVDLFTTDELVEARMKIKEGRPMVTMELLPKSWKEWISTTWFWSIAIVLSHKKKQQSRAMKNQQSSNPLYWAVQHPREGLHQCRNSKRWSEARNGRSFKLTSASVVY